MVKPPVAPHSGAETSVSDAPSVPAQKQLITTMESAEVLGISVANFQKKIGAEGSILKPAGKDGKANLFDLDEVLKFGETVQTRATVAKPDPMIRFQEIAEAYIARRIKVWTIADKKTKAVLAILPGQTEAVAEFNAKRRFKGVEFTIKPYETITIVQSTPSAKNAIVESKS